MSKEVVLIGYSGHAFVVADALLSQGIKIIGYCERSEKKMNPYNLKYLGNENEIAEQLKKTSCIVSIGDNSLRQKVQTKLLAANVNVINAIHSSALVSPTIKIGNGVLISAKAIINSMAEIGNGVICNSSSVIEHECVIQEYVHIGPGAILCGNVNVGANTLIGAGSVIIPNITIGKNVIIGAGSVVVKDIPDNSIVKGNPAK